MGDMTNGSTRKFYPENLKEKRYLDNSGECLEVTLKETLKRGRGC
jgi:hypothetical protein